jgi:hypothetical protein
MVGYPSGQRGQTVNLLAYAFSGSNPEPTTTLFPQGNSGFCQVNQWFCKLPGVESLLLRAFGFSCVPVLLITDKAIIKQSNQNKQEFARQAKRASRITMRTETGMVSGGG